MSKHEGRIFLERLVELRETYKVTEHHATSITVAQTIAYAIDLLNDPDRLDAVLADSPADAATSLHNA